MMVKFGYPIENALATKIVPADGVVKGNLAAAKSMKKPPEKK